MILTKQFTSSTALLLFAQSKNAQSMSKPIACQKKQTVLLWEKMNERVLRTISKTKLPYFVSDESIQVGMTFGDKLTHAIEEIFQEGFEKVIVVGNDCLVLQTTHLIEAANHLQTNDFVLGGDYNGGAYLIGVTKSSFNASAFKAISWQTCSVFKELKHLFCLNNTVQLPILNDCNDATDFKKAVHTLSNLDGIKPFLLSIFENESIPNQYETSLDSHAFCDLNLNKGSP